MRSTPSARVVGPMTSETTCKLVRRCVARGYDQATNINHKTEPEDRNWRKLLLDTITHHLVSSQDLSISNPESEPHLNTVWPFQSLLIPKADKE